MLAFIVRRVLGAITIVFLVVLLVFTLVHAIGDPAAATLGPNAGPEQLADFQRKYGLDRPLGQQLLGYLGVGGCVRGRRPAIVEDDLSAQLERAGLDVARPHRTSEESALPSSHGEITAELTKAGEAWELALVATDAGGAAQTFRASGNV
ncbi:MAG TPA: hypothetical protein RMI62_06340, partial [Polyangiaceae bacterium LLY-WYZ-15_(1-7)]|nr:hypothetical protein [Polyangiaceae bacterium LLY-WYZ-15_(1-7)]